MSHSQILRTPAHTHTQHPAMMPKVMHWFEIIKNCALPILPHTGRTLQHQLHQNNSALIHIAATIEQDPIACLMVLKAANAIRQNTSRRDTVEHTDIISITHCITVLGLENLKQLIAQTPILEPHITSSSYVNFLNSLMRSLHAAHQAQTWAKHHGHHQPEIIFLSTLLYQAPYWALWRSATAEMKIIEHLIMNERVPTDEAENAVLGTNIRPLTLALAAHWQLPQVIQNAYQHENVIDRKILLRAGHLNAQGQLNTLANLKIQNVSAHRTSLTIRLAHWMALETDISWHSRYLQRAMRIVSAFLNQPLKKTEHEIKHTALTVSRTYPIPGIPNPGKHLITPREAPKRRTLSPEKIDPFVSKLLQHRDTLAQDSPATLPADKLINHTIQYVYALSTSDTPTVNTPSQKAKPKPTPQTPISTDIKDPILLKALYTQLNYHANEFDNAISVYRCLTQALQEGIGLERVIILLPNQQKTHLYMHRMNKRLWEADKAKKFSLKPKNLFTNLTQQASTIWANASDGGRIMTLLPATFKAVTGNNDHFFMASIGEPNHLFCVIYADQGEDGGQLHESHFKLFKAFCKTTALWVSHLY